MQLQSEPKVAATADADRLGAMGSAACYQLAKRGARICGIDRYSPPHTLGSTHGDTRITRLAISRNGKLFFFYRPDCRAGE